MTHASGYDWYVLNNGTPTGPVSAQDLAVLAMQRHVRSDDLVWCEGLAGWMPLGAVLAASEQPKLRPRTYTVEAEPVDRRATATRVVSLSRLYVEKLTELKLAPVPSAKAQSTLDPTREASHAAAVDGGGAAAAEVRGFAPKRPGLRMSEPHVSGRLVEVPDWGGRETGRDGDNAHGAGTAGSMGSYVSGIADTLQSSVAALVSAGGPAPSPASAKIGYPEAARRPATTGYAWPG